MTMRLDLRSRGAGLFGGPVLNPTPFGCADCGRWFQFARELVQHDCEMNEVVIQQTQGNGLDAHCRTCGAIPGEECQSQSKHHTTTHAARR